MKWVIKFPTGETIDLDELEPEFFDKIATEHEEVGNWWACYASPGGSSARLYWVVDACARRLGVDPPARPTTMPEAQLLLEMLDVKVPIEDQAIVDGFPQLPGVPENGSTSGVPGDSDGRKLSPELNPSASS